MFWRLLWQLWLWRFCKSHPIEGFSPCFFLPLFLASFLSAFLDNFLGGGVGGGGRGMVDGR